MTIDARCADLAATPSPTSRPAEPDPHLYQRGYAYQETQTSLPGSLSSNWVESRFPDLSSGAPFMSWRSNGELLVADVRCPTEINAERPLRLGLGQIRHVLQECRAKAVAVLVLERRPFDGAWVDDCVGASTSDAKLSRSVQLVLAASFGSPTLTGRESS
jgi:hypothetical protein